MHGFQSPSWKLKSGRKKSQFHLTWNELSYWFGVQCNGCKSQNLLWAKNNKYRMDDMPERRYSTAIRPIENNLSIWRRTKTYTEMWIQRRIKHSARNFEIHIKLFYFQCEIQFEKKTRFSIKFRDLFWHIKQTAEQHLKYQQLLAHFTRWCLPCAEIIQMLGRQRRCGRAHDEKSICVVHHSPSATRRTKDLAVCVYLCLCKWKLKSWNISCTRRRLHFPTGWHKLVVFVAIYGVPFVYVSSRLTWHPFNFRCLARCTTDFRQNPKSSAEYRSVNKQTDSREKYHRAPAASDKGWNFIDFPLGIRTERVKEDYQLF